MTSCITNLKIFKNCKKGIKPTGRVTVDGLSEFIAIHIWEVIIVDVLLELRVGPGVGGDQEELCRLQGYTHVMLRFAKLKRVPSSSQLPEVVGLVGQRGMQKI